MVTRFQRVLRLFIALLALSGAGAIVTEPAAAAPSAYAAAFAREELPAAESRRTAARARVPVFVAAAHAHGHAHAPPLSAAAPRAPALRRAPRLYLRHCVLLR
jgi:hypothetical protein